MNFSRFIYISIALFVLLIFILIGKIITLPHIKVGPAALNPDYITEGASTSSIITLLIIVVLIIGLFIFLWIMYKVLRKIPLIGKIIIKALGFIFGPCIKSGIFGFFDMVSEVTKVSTLSIPDRLARVGKGLSNFLEVGAGFILSGANNVPVDTPTTTTGTNKREDDEVDKKFTDTDNQYINDQYSMCLQENLLEITPDMTSNDKKYAISKNQTARTICKTKQFQSIMDTIVMKI